MRSHLSKKEHRLLRPYNLAFYYSFSYNILLIPSDVKLLVSKIKLTFFLCKVKEPKNV